MTPPDDGRSLVNQTLLWGGALLIAGGAVQIVTVRIAPEPTQGSSYTLLNYYLPAAVSATLVLAGCLVLATGLRRSGDVVGGTPWGRIALLGFGGCHAYLAWSGVFADVGLTLLAQLGILFALLVPLFAVASALVIAWQRTLPGGWSVFPGLVLAFVVAAAAFSQMPGVVPPSFGYVVTTIVPWVLLGTVAVVLAGRTPTLVPRPRRGGENVSHCSL